MKKSNLKLFKKFFSSKDKYVVKNRTHPYIGRILTGQGDKNSSTRSLKSESTSVIRQVISKTSMRESIKKRTMGVICPTSYFDFCKKLPTTPANNLIDELRWSAILIDINKDIINSFIIDRMRYENLLLQDKINDAQVVLDRITDNCGFSLWSIDAQINIAEMRGGIEANKAYYKELRTSTDDYHARVTGQFASYRAEELLTSRAYDTSVYSFFGKDPTKENSSLNSKYLYLKINPFLLTGFTEYDLLYALNFESSYALIDKYLLTLRVLLNIFAINEFDIFSEISRPALQILSLIKNDSLLNSFICCVEPQNIARENELSRKVLDIIEKYTIGEYNECIEKSIDILSQHPSSFEVCELYCRSEIYLGKEHQCPFEPSQPIAAICRSVYKILKKEGQLEGDFENLLKWSYKLSFLPIGFQIRCFIAEHSHMLEFNKHRSIRDLTSSVKTPRFSTIYNNSDKAEEYLCALSSINRGGAAIALFKSRMNCCSLSSNVNSSTPPLRQLKYEAQKNEMIGDFSKAENCYRLLYEKSTRNPILKSEAIAGLCRTLLNNDKIIECARFFLKIKFSQEELLSSVAIKPILEKYSQCGEVNYDSSIVWPVLYHLYYHENELPKNNEFLFRLYHKYLNTEECTRPTELLKKLERDNNGELIYFLRYICVPEIMDSSFYFSTTKELEEERICICQELLKLDPKNLSTYDKELSDRLRVQSIMEVIQYVDSSKVYVDVDGIKRSVDEEYIAVYNRYRILSGFTKELREVVQWEPKKDKGNGNDSIEITFDSADVLFESLFNQIKEQYLFSNEFGLDTYLSIRIRHGTLVGQLRSVFEKHHLITIIDSSEGKYHKNAYWDKKFNGIPHDLDQSLQKFSSKVDKLIAKVRDEWIQIFTEKDSSKGMFNFYYSEHDFISLRSQFEQVVDVEDFVDMCLDELNFRAEENLKNIRSSINGTLRDQLTLFLDDLHNQATLLAYNDAKSPFLTAINQCRTNIYSEVTLIAGWFETVRQTRMPDKIPLQFLIETATQHMKRAHIEGDFSAVVHSIPDIPVAGKHIFHLLDALQNILDNAFKHSDPQKKDIEILASANEGRVSITIQNKMRSDYSAAADNIAEYKHRLQSYAKTKAISREGNSGFIKLGRIVNFNLQDIVAEVDLNILNQDDRFIFSVNLAFNAEVN